MPEERAGRRPRLAVTLGDPRGIGPEVAARALASPELREAADFLVLGPAGAFPAETPGIAFTSVGSWGPEDGAAAAGRVAGEAVRAAVELALSGEVDGIVTAPLDKAAFRAGGWSHPGHTELLRDLCGARNVGMMMAAEATGERPALRVVLATTHLPLRDVVGALSPELLVEQARLTRDALRDWWEIERPRIAFCAVNPHAGDGGLFGDEEARIIAPAMERLGRMGIVTHGPVPADTVFTRALSGEWDAVVAPYHDVGMAAFKTATFGRGINVTLGLPFPRTSPDHGVALDLAGRGRADPSSMIAAVRLAARLAARFDSRR